MAAEGDPGARETFTTREVGYGDAAGLAALFEASHSTCHCRYWHFSGDKNEWLDRCANAPSENRREMDEALRTASPEGRGVVAIDAEGRIVGWLKLTPVGHVPKAFEQRYYRALPCFMGDREGVHLIGCVLVHPSKRRRGVASALVEGALELAATYGARAVEALPRRTEWAVGDEELWMGPLSVYRALGFVEVHREPGPSDHPDPYPVLRRELVRRDG